MLTLRDRFRDIQSDDSRKVSNNEVDKNRYWLYNCQNSMDITDADNIDIVKSIESRALWEELGIYLFCSLCKKLVGAQSYHCDNCEGFDVCRSCFGGQSYRDILVKAHNGHKVILVRYRPLATPMYDGSDCQLLERFSTVKSEKEFYLYFPFFFHDIAGMDEFSSVIKKAQRELYLQRHDIGSRDWQYLMKTLDFPTDWFVRVYGYGNWQSLHRSCMRVHVKRRLSAAQMTAQLYKLLVKLRYFRLLKERRYGSGDIPANYHSISFRRLITNSASGDYEAYLLPLHIGTELNKEVNLGKLDAVLPSEENLRTWATEHYLGPFVLFRAIFKDHPEFYTIEQHCWENSSKQFQAYYLLKDEWVSLMKNHMETRRSCLDVKYDEIARVSPSALDGFKLRYSSFHQKRDLKKTKIFKLVGVARELRESGHFERAIALLKQQDLTDPLLAFELQCVFQEQGYHNKEVEWIAAIRTWERMDLLSVECSDSLRLTGLAAFNLEAIDLLGLTYSAAKKWFFDTLYGRGLLRLILAYHECYSKGRWITAMSIANEAWDCCLKDWSLPDLSAESVMTLVSSLLHLFTSLAKQSKVYMEIYYHRILLACLRDQGETYNSHNAVSRLEHIRLVLQELGCLYEAWSVLQLQLEIAKTPYRAQYRESEATFSLTEYSHVPAVAIPLVQSFMNQCTTLARPHWSMLRAHATLQLAELQRQQGSFQLATELAAEANQIYTSGDSPRGLHDYAMYRLESAQRRPAGFSMIRPLFTALRKDNDIGRLRKVRKYNFDVGPSFTETVADDAEVRWHSHQRVDLMDLALEAGNLVEATRWKLRKYSSDWLAGAVIADNEAMLREDAFPRSALLVRIATFNLANAYLTQGNHFDSTLHSLLHKYVLNNGDVELHQRAMLLILKTFEAGFASQDIRAQKDTIREIAKSWNGWLTDEAPLRWRVTGPRCDEIERFIDGACFVPCLVALMARSCVDSIEIDEDVAKVVLQHLHIAFQLFACLPSYVTSAIVPRLALALGSAAIYAGNRELASRAYHDGLQVVHSGDHWSIANLRLAAGKALTSLTSEDPESWAHVLGAGRSLLQSSIELFQRNIHLEGALLRCCGAYLALLQSYVAEARGLKLIFDRGVPSITQRVEIPRQVDLAQRREAFAKLDPLIKKGVETFHAANHFLYLVRRELILTSRYEKVRNLRYLTSGPLASQLFDLAYEIALIDVVPAFIPSPEGINQYERFCGLWGLVQNRKSTVLLEQTQEFQQATIIEDIKSNTTAWQMYLQEQELIRGGRHSSADFRLWVHWDKMEEVPELKRLLESRKTKGATIESLKTLKDIAHGSLNDGQHIILIDWAQYGLYYWIFGYDVTVGKLIFAEILFKLEVKDVERWVNSHLGNGVDSKVQLNHETAFSDLYEMVEPIHRFVQYPNSLLIFSPTSILHAIPLHALPFKDTEDYPIIYYFPVIYCPSAAILQNVVKRSLEPRTEPFNAAFLGRYGQSRGGTEAAIEAGLADLKADFLSLNVQTKLVVGKALTRETLKSSIKESHLIHFLGHANGKQFTQHLELENAEPLLNDETSDKEGHSRLVSQFRLQDAFAASIPPALVMLIACSSGTQDVALNDDTLGLLTAFFTAGATTVVGTLWPIDSKDGLEFSKLFYKESFLRKDGRAVIGPAGEKRRLVNLAVAMQKAILGMRASDNELCMDDEKQVFPRETWRWAGYVLQGSWVNQGICKENGDGALLSKDGRD